MVLKSIYLPKDNTTLTVPSCNTILVEQYTCEFLIFACFRFWAIVVKGRSEGFKLIIIVLGAWLAIEIGIPAPLMVAVLPESLLPLVIFGQNSVFFLTFPRAVFLQYYVSSVGLLVIVFL